MKHSALAFLAPILCHFFLSLSCAFSSAFPVVSLNSRFTVSTVSTAFTFYVLTSYILLHTLPNNSTAHLPNGPLFMSCPSQEPPRQIGVPELLTETLLFLDTRIDVH